jgi:hypothetical protein
LATKSEREDHSSPPVTERMLFTHDGTFIVTRFDSKNYEDSQPKKNGEYVPVLSYLQSKSRNKKPMSDGV